jgi:hypothetical protein
VFLQGTCLTLGHPLTGFVTHVRNFQGSGLLSDGLQWGAAARGALSVCVLKTPVVEKWSRPTETLKLDPSRLE